MTEQSKILSGSTIKVYTGDVGETATTIVVGTGAIVPASADWTLVAAGRYPDGVTIENMDERTQLRFQGSKGRASEERRTETGLMITMAAWEATPDLAKLSWGNDITTTAAALGQVGIYKQDFDLPLSVPEHGVEIVISSPYDVTDSEGWLALIHIPKATLKIGAFALAVDPEATPLEIRQLDYSSAAWWQTVFADATT